MSVSVEKLENNMAKLTIEVDAEVFENAVEAVYKSQRGKIALPGFRKGKAPRKMIEKAYGEGVFYEDAANKIIPGEYSKAAKESGLEIVSQPDIDIVQIGSGQTFIFTAEVALKPEVELGTYLGVEVSKQDLAVTDEEVMAEIDKERDNNSRMVSVEDRAVEDGDTTIIDYAGSIDGVPFAGGTAEGQELVIGSHAFIAGFEEQVIGMNIGDEKDINVTFPEEYHAADLAGKPAVFKVKLHEIKTKELPELDDDFAMDVSDFDTLDEYKADVKAKLENKKEVTAKRAKEDEAIQKVIENSKMDIPQAMIDTQAGYLVDNFAQRITSQGIPMDQYLQLTGLTYDKMLEQMKPEALKRIQVRLVLEAIAKAEKIEISEEAVEEELKKMAEQYKMELDKIKEMMQDSEKEQMKEDLAVEKAAELVRDSAKEV